MVAAALELAAGVELAEFALQDVPAPVTLDEDGAVVEGDLAHLGLAAGAERGGGHTDPQQLA